MTGKLWTQITLRNKKKIYIYIYIYIINIIAYITIQNLIKIGVKSSIFWIGILFYWIIIDDISKFDP